MSKVNYGTDLIQEYVSHCFGVPFSKRAFCERHKVSEGKLGSGKLEAVGRLEAGISVELETVAI